MTCFPRLIALGALAATSGMATLAQVGAAQADATPGPSAYGCVGLSEDRDFPVLEGRDGVFYRVNADLRMNHPFSDEVVGWLAELSEALESRGTTLVYVPIPTKSVSMPQYLPEVSGLYGFDLEVATEVHLDIQRRLEAAGVVAVDIRERLLTAEAGRLAFFGPDFHWSAYGADLGAQAIADVLRGHDSYASLDQTEYTSEETGEEVAFSGMRRILQARCTGTLPDPVTMTYDTQPVSLDLGLSGDGAALDLFGTDTAVLPVALVGTSFSDSPINNFPGFIAQHSALEVVNYAITGGNQFGAITSYLTSEEFQENPPAFLVWENPIYNNLAQYGDQPMRELIAAAHQNCRAPLPVAVAEDRLSIRADLSGVPVRDTHSIRLDGDGTGALELDFAFTGQGGAVRVKSLERGERLRRTSRFYMPLSGLWPEGAEAVEVRLSAPLGPDAQLYLCDATHKEEES